MQRVVGWLRKGGAVDALCPITDYDGQTATASLLYVAAGKAHLELVRELLNRGASVDLQNSNGGTGLMGAADHGHLPILLLLLQHSANPDLQDVDGLTALLVAAT